MLHAVVHCWTAEVVSYKAQTCGMCMQYMVGYTFLMATGVNLLFACNGANFSVLQVRLQPHAAETDNSSLYLLMYIFFWSQCSKPRYPSFVVICVHLCPL